MNLSPKAPNPKKLLQALNTLAHAEYHMLNEQSELDFYKDILRRLNANEQKTLHKHLNGRAGIKPYATAFGKKAFLASRTLADYRWRQLDTLAQATGA
jgi:hypothetical protein